MIAHDNVLYPACGSGNFLYVALHALKDIELRALVDSERLGLPARVPRVGLECVRGIEIEEYAAELARVTLWIGDLQWMRKNGYTGFAEPILSNLDQIENRDALLNPDGTEAEWPAADVIIGNPPFVGGKTKIALAQAAIDLAGYSFRREIIKYAFPTSQMGPWMSQRTAHLFRDSANQQGELARAVIQVHPLSKIVNKPV